MRVYLFILVLCCCLLASCSSIGSGFPLEETLTQELMPLQGITNPMLVEIKSPFLILKNWKMHDSIFHIYDLTSNELKWVFGTEGQGPGEFISPSLFQTQLPGILIGDFGKNEVIRFDIDRNGQPVFKESQKLVYDNALYDAAFINDSLYIADPKYMLIPSLYLLARGDSLPRKIWTYRNPNILDYSLDPDKGEVYASENHIVFCYSYKKQIDFMDTAFNLVKRVKFEYDDPTDITGDNYDDVKISYTRGYLGKRYFYAMFLGRSWKKHRENFTKGTFLEVFDLDGNPIIRYYLEGKCPSNFAVDEETFTLYGATEDGEPEDYLLMYKLKGLS